jgi:hypothetical protein
MDDRYQFQSWPVRVYRWLRWKPLYATIAAWHVLRWLAAGAPRIDMGSDECGEWLLSRWESCKHVWNVSCARAEMKMKHYWTLDEVMGRLGKDQPQ